jgi:hypothetical protein
MAEILLFHHALGQTPGFADELRGAGHTVHTPDLYSGRIFAALDDGMAYARSIGMREIIERGGRAALFRRFQPALVRRGRRGVVDEAHTRVPARIALPGKVATHGLDQ